MAVKRVMNTDKKYNKYESDNHNYFVLPNSLAEKDIKRIIEIQEKCFQDICLILNFKPSLNINMYFFDDPKSCGKSYDINSTEERTINGFCYYPNNIHATYGSKVKAIGAHETAHLLLYKKLNNKAPITFLDEGFAVFCDNQWWEMDLHKWAKYLYDTNTLDIGLALTEIDYFFENNALSYAVVGSYAKRIIEDNGFDYFYSLLSQSLDNDNFRIPNIDEYLDYLNTIELSTEESLVFEKLVCKSGIQKKYKS